MINLTITLLAFFIAITIHEFAHAWMADKLGDPTAKIKGRLSLNPIAHIDLYGTILIPLFLVFVHSPFIFGWAKPVQFDPFNLKNPRKDSAYISLAGPAANLILAILLSITLRLLSMSGTSLQFITLLYAIISPIIIINVVLAVFNLIPIHPLDGGKILVGILPKKDAYEADKFLRRYGTLILLFLIFPTLRGASPISYFLSPVINFFVQILLPISPLI